MIPAPLGHLAYKVAYVGLRIWSFVRRPRTRGVKCIVTFGDEVLLVRHSYGPRLWELPGGFAHGGEPFVDTARRELAEELSIMEPLALTELGVVARDYVGRHETLGAVAVALAGPEIEIRGFELLRTGWFRRDALPPRRSELVDRVLALERGLPRDGQG